MAKKTPKRRLLPLHDRLPLFRWLLAQFGFQSFKDAHAVLGRPELELRHETGSTSFLFALLASTPSGVGLSEQTLREYDTRICAHSDRVFRLREAPWRWKYFQYLSLMFVEHFLELHFRDPAALLSRLDAFLSDLNAGQLSQDPVPAFTSEDLERVALWCATGAGKTLLMHVNYLQYLDAAKRHRREHLINRTILLVPNERLSVQHHREFLLSGIGADVFSKDLPEIWNSNRITIVDVHKLREEGKQKTISVSAFGRNNLVLVDEGHRGSSGEEWRRLREELCRDGFVFEYSATFGQAVDGSQGPLRDDYAKSVAFD